MEGIAGDAAITVAIYPLAWRIEVVNDNIHRGFEYVRSGQTLLDAVKRFTDTARQHLLGNHGLGLESNWGIQNRWYKGRELASSNEPQLNDSNA